jgi:hypothetical protein
VANSTTTLPRFDVRSTLTLVLRWLESSSSRRLCPDTIGHRGRRLGVVVSPTVVLPDHVLDGPHGQTFSHHRLGQRLLKTPVRGAQESAGMPWTDLALRKQTLNAGRKLQQAKDISHRGTALAHPLGHLLMGVPELLDELLVGRGLLVSSDVSTSTGID